MKTVIIGGSKILLALVAVVTVLIGAVLLWFKFGIRPYDRLNAQVISLGKSDPDQALALYPAVFAEADKARISQEDRSNLYIQKGRFLMDHGHEDEAVENLNKSVEWCRKSWRGNTEACALLDLAQCRLKQKNSKPVKRADLDSLLVAEQVHIARNTGNDKWFWPDYDQTVGDLYAALGDYPKALQNFQKVLEWGVADGTSQYIIQQAQCRIIAALVKQGKYVEANKKFVEFVSQVPEGESDRMLNNAFRTSLKAAQDNDPGFHDRVMAMLNQKQFVELDKLADQLQASKKIWPSGRWRVNDLYQVVDHMDDQSFDDIWQARISLLEQWIKARPNSARARVAIGAVLSSYAWKARGGGYSDSVSEAGWKKFGERLEQAKAVMDQVKDKPPEWYSVMQRCALGQGWETAKYDAMVAECQKRYPDYDLVVFNKCYWLQPRWHGQDGEFEQYIAAQADKRGGVPGDIMYGRAAWHLDDYAIGDVMTQTKMSWPRVKSGVQAVIKQYPESLLAKGTLSILAMEAKDKKTALSAFTEDKKAD